MQLFLAGIPILFSAIPLGMLIFDENLTLAEQETIATTVGILTPIIILTVIFGFLKFASVPCEILMDTAGMLISPLKDSFFYRERISIEYAKISKIYFQTFRGEKTVIHSPLTGQIMIQMPNLFVSKQEDTIIYKQFVQELADRTGVPSPYQK